MKQYSHATIRISCSGFKDQSPSRSDQKTVEKRQQCVIGYSPSKKDKENGGYEWSITNHEESQDVRDPLSPSKLKFVNNFGSNTDNNSHVTFSPKKCDNYNYQCNISSNRGSLDKFDKFARIDPDNSNPFRVRKTKQ
jgi:hypothetical protein